jgi:hypothetical protein
MLGSSIFTELLDMGWKVERIPAIVHMMAITSMGAVALKSSNRYAPSFVAFVVRHVLDPSQN